MRIVSTSYSNTPEYTNPVAWLKRISFYTGILEELAKDHEVTSIERIRYRGRLSQNGVDYRFIDLRKKTVLFPFEMHRMIRRIQPDVVLVNGFIFPLQIIQLRLKLGLRPKIIVLHRAEKPFSGLKGKLQQLADRCVDGYLFSSREGAGQWIRNGIISSASKIHQVVQASSRFRPLAEKNGGDTTPRFLWVGRLEKNKDPLTVVKAFICFLQTHPDVSLFMIFQTEELLETVRQMTMSFPSIQLIGKVEHQQLSSWYQSADFIVSGSHYEGGGTVISEAMSCGCIPVITDIPSFRAITGYGKCGLLYEAGNELALVEKLEEAVRMDRASEREKVLKQFGEELSFPAIAGKISFMIKNQ